MGEDVMLVKVKEEMKETAEMKEEKDNEYYPKVEGVGRYNIAS